MRMDRIRRGTRIALVGAGLGIAVMVSGCTRAAVISAQPLGASSSPTLAPATAAPAAPTASPVVDPAPPATTRSTTHFYAKARTQWTQGASAISAQEGLYWSKAASDLQAGENTDSGDTSGYPKAIDELKNLAALPDAQQTPAQNAQYHTDIDDLNAFFGTPGLYS